MNKNLAIMGGKPYKETAFPGWPISDERDKQYLNEVLESGKWWRMTGSKVREFESRFAQLHHVKHCLCVTNGTHAIELALTALGIQSGDEVIVPAFTFISTASATVYSNVKPIFVDVDPDTFCMIPEAFEKAITKKTKAVIPVHMAGQMCDMPRICTIAKKQNIKIIEDAAHAHGAEWDGKKAGTFGDFAIFSFQNGKIMTCGEVGALVTNDTQLYEKAYLIHGVGRPKNDRIYQHLMLGSNYRMNEFSAAILLAQLERLEEQNKKREINAKKLDELFFDFNGITPQKRLPQASLHTHYMYMFYYDKSYFGNLNRQDFVDCLIAEGIPAFIAYPTITETHIFKNECFNNRISSYKAEDTHNLSNSLKISDEVVWLPHFTLLGDEQDIVDIAKAIEKIRSLMN